jgi:hypothetical protein
MGLSYLGRIAMRRDGEFYSKDYISLCLAKSRSSNFLFFYRLDFFFGSFILYQDKRKNNMSIMIRKTL